MTLENFSHDTKWPIDTRVLAHIGDPGMLENLRRYLGNDVIIIGDSSSYAITRVYTNNDAAKIKLKESLLVPTLAINLLSIR